MTTHFPTLVEPSPVIRRKNFEAALRAAERSGWIVEMKPKGRGHAWGRVRSPDDSVAIRVDGTPRNPGDRARDIGRAVRRWEREAR